MKKIKFHVLILILGLGFTTSCDKEKDINPSIDNNVQIASEKGRIELGNFVMVNSKERPTTALTGKLIISA